MKYNIQVMSKDEIIHKCKINELNNCIVISINCPNTNTKIKNKSIIDLLTLYFHDIDEKIGDLIPMTLNDAYKIKNFIEKYKDKVNNIIIHCTAGISRSAGVACAIALYLNSTDNYLWSNRRYIPNKLCYNLTLTAFGIKTTNTEILEKEKLRCT